MASYSKFTRGYLGVYHRVPPRGRGVCPICRSGPNDGFEICQSCRLTMSQVGRPTRQILPISLYRVDEQCWYLLRNYKDHPDEDVRRKLAITLAATVAQFLARHDKCVQSVLGGPPSVVTTVPSTRPNPTGRQHPLVGVVRMVQRLASIHRPLLCRGTGVVDHNCAGDDVFLLQGNVAGDRVLLIEDTFTTGARAQSAASTLLLSGAQSVAVLVAGRVINPSWNENCRRIWTYAQRPFDFEVCGHCSMDAV